jgi:hypothetical protein
MDPIGSHRQGNIDTIINKLAEIALALSQSKIVWGGLAAHKRNSMLVSSSGGGQSAFLSSGRGVEIRRTYLSTDGSGRFRNVEKRSRVAFLLAELDNRHAAFYRFLEGTFERQ